MQNVSKIKLCRWYSSNIQKYTIFYVSELLFQCFKKLHKHAHMILNTVTVFNSKLLLLNLPRKKSRTLHAARGLKLRDMDYRICLYSFHRLILRYHPEEPGADADTERIFYQIAEAYDVLRDPQRRAVYDQYGIKGLREGVPGPEEYIKAYHYHGDPMRTYREFFGTDSPFADLLDAVTFPKPIYRTPELCGYKKKEDTIYRPLHLTLEEVFHGGIKKLKMTRLVLREDQITTEAQEQVLRVNIQRGILPGSEFCFPEAGNQGHTIIPADIMFVTEDRPHERFRREGTDLIMVAHISLLDALIGLTITVNTLDGRTLHVPITDVVQPGYIKIVDSEGMPLMEDPDKRGNLQIHFDIEFPKYIPRPGKVLLRKAWDAITKGGLQGGPEDINRLILHDKMRRMRPMEKLPPTI